MPPAAVLVAATRVEGEALGLSGILGTIEEGAWADILLVKDRPWDDIRSLRDPVIVIKNGQVMADQRRSD
jgi:imidazolonepropionase-like amidohydrolase